jgi:hypothetical protein
VSRASRRLTSGYLGLSPPGSPASDAALHNAHRFALRHPFRAILRGRQRDRSWPDGIQQCFSEPQPRQVGSLLRAGLDR